MKFSALSLSLILLLQGSFAEADPLPNWNEGDTKKSIIRFVENTTRKGSAGFIPESERIAVFDNDGTLWAEQPMYFQLAFAIDRIKELAPKHPEWKSKEPFKFVIAGDLKSALADKQQILALVLASHSGMTTEEFDAVVTKWIGSARHPKTGKLYTEMIYEPMLDVMNYLRSSGFKTYIVSGGGIDFMRPWVEKAYGIPPEQVVGSRGKLKFELRDGKPVLDKLPELEFIDDGPGKPAGINQIIGRRPVMAFGNSDGDLQMLQWTCSAPGPRFCLYVHHTDSEREWAYDRASHIGRLDKGLDEAKAKGWAVANIQQDWKTVFP